MTDPSMHDSLIWHWQRIDDIRDTKDTCVSLASNRMTGCMRTVDYIRGHGEPHYQVPAIPMKARWYPKQTQNHTLCVILELRPTDCQWWCSTGWWSA